MPRSRLLELVLYVLCVALVVAMLPGCTKSPTVTDPLDDYRPLMQLAVSVSIDRVLDAHPELAENAMQVTKVAVDAVNGGKFTSVKEAVQFFSSLIPFDKMEEDARTLVQMSIDATAAQIQVIANRYKVPETKRLTLVRDIMQWCNDVAVRHVREENQAAKEGRRKKIRAMR